jgi:hypothetical protein
VAGGVIHGPDERQAWTLRTEPLVLAAIDQHQVALAILALTSAVVERRPPCVYRLQAQGDPQAAHAVVAHGHPLAFQQVDHMAVVQPNLLVPQQRLDPLARLLV